MGGCWGGGTSLAWPFCVFCDTIIKRDPFIYLRVRETESRKQQKFGWQRKQTAVGWRQWFWLFVSLIKKQRFFGSLFTATPRAPPPQIFLFFFTLFYSFLSFYTNIDTLHTPFIINQFILLYHLIKDFFYIYNMNFIKNKMT